MSDEPSKSTRWRWLQLAAALGLILAGFVMRRVGLAGVYTGHTEPLLSWSMACGVFAAWSPIVTAAGALLLLMLVAVEIIDPRRR
jgi:hypothetical protein